MKNLSNPKWILIATTLPSLILVVLFYRTFTIIDSILEPYSLQAWYTSAILFLMATILTTGYAIFKIVRNQKVSIRYAMVTMSAYLIGLYTYFNKTNLFVPWEIPGWMVPESLSLNVSSLLMPTLLYCLILIVSWSLEQRKSSNPWFNLLYAVCIPIFMYVFVNIIVPFWQPVGSEFYDHSFIILGVLATIAFLFFILRWVYLIVIKKGRWDISKLGFRITFGILFPILGLLINNGNLNDPFHFNNGVFGNFNSHWFYIIALLNGFFLCFNHRNIPQFRFARFVGRSLTFPYILYFFLVFLPYLPLSVFATLVLGLGFLMLTPIILLLVQSKDLFDDFQELQKYHSAFKLRAISIFSMLIIPIFITISYLGHKNVLNATLDSIYSPNYNKPVDINLKSLSHTIKHIKENRKHTDWFMNGSRTPFLSGYFSWLVLDNLTLSNDKIRKIENIYFGVSTTYTIPPPSSHNEVVISDIKSSSNYDPQQNVWESWIDLEITNNRARRFAEYGTRINLPVGCWIMDYYLFVEGKKEMGILAEKKSAMWIYSQIRNQNRDPGILNYTSGNEVAFRVFPFKANETRKTGIKFIHKEPVTIQIDGEVVTLGDDRKLQPQNQSHNSESNTVYISSLEKSALPKITRRPYFHFIVDASVGKESEIQQTVNHINNILESYPNLLQNSKVTFTNYHNLTLDINDDWKTKLGKHKFEGGFYLESAIKKVLFDSYQSKSLTSPRIVVISENLGNSIISKNFSDLKIAFPENDLFYSINSNSTLIPHALTKNPKKVIRNLPIQLNQKEVYAWPDAINPSAFLPIDNQASIVLKKSKHALENPNKDKWHSALQLHGQWISQCLHPETSNDRWLDLVKGSFSSRILTPLTSFIVVENEAQKEMLLRKQKQVLNGNKNLDLNGDVQSMSEPEVWILLIFIVWLILYKSRYFRYQKS